MFDSWNSFLSFAEKTRHNIRYLQDEEMQQFLAQVMETARDRFEFIPKGQQYWRAQLGSDKNPVDDGAGEIVGYDPVPYRHERMKPLPKKASEGRVNPKGIPYLYLATNEKTAISEVRPWVGTYVTLAEFQTCKSLKLVDCSRCEINPLGITASDFDLLWKVKPPTSEEVIDIVWRWIAMAFFEPVDRDDSSAEYVPTQIIAELFKTNGLDGVKYRSLFKGGDNVALFDIDSATQIDGGRVVQVTKIDLDFKQIHPPVFPKSRS